LTAQQIDLLVVPPSRAGVAQRFRPWAPAATVARRERADWRRQYARLVLAVDTVMLAFASLTGWVARFGVQDSHISAGSYGVPYLAVAVLVVPVWLSVIGLSRGYEDRFLGSGTEEYKRIANSSFRFIAVLAMLAYAARLDIARGYVGIALPLGTAMLLLGRWICRLEMAARRRRGEWSDAVVVVGGANEARELVAQMRRDPVAGLVPVGACVPAHPSSVLECDDARIPVIGGLTDVLRAVDQTRAHVVAVTAGRGLSSSALRQLSWSLEGRGVELYVAPSLTDVAGPRITMRPVAGMPLLHIEEPELTGLRRFVKGTFDRVVAGLAVLALLPVLGACALAVMVSSRGPVLFRQTRVGKDGSTFTMLKFRSMYRDAESRLHTIIDLNQGNGVLFKLRVDPRVTPVGKFLRKYSLDELPQLLNVVLGHMSLVGPRPNLPREVDEYAPDVHRRHLVKPGITGLWQVNGRSELSWEETVRQDLFYVENWSLPLDLSILVKTVRAVVKGSGAY
jgi:exopolysaccharide biosynthesis polyprenyl glycosylphosphotransferase